MKYVYNKVRLNSTKYTVAYMYKSAALCIRCAWRAHLARREEQINNPYVHPRDMRHDVRLKA